MLNQCSELRGSEAETETFRRKDAQGLNRPWLPGNRLTRGLPVRFQFRRSDHESIIY